MSSTDLGARLQGLLTERLGRIRATDPKKFALFTGRDQMQALTGLFARQFGTEPAARRLLFGEAGWRDLFGPAAASGEFAGPDLDRAKLFVMMSTARRPPQQPDEEDRLGRLRPGGRFVSIGNAHRLFGDRRQVIPIRPGTDGALFMALLHNCSRKAWSTGPSYAAVH